MGWTEDGRDDERTGAAASLVLFCLPRLKEEKEEDSIEWGLFRTLLPPE